MENIKFKIKAMFAFKNDYSTEIERETRITLPKEEFKRLLIEKKIKIRKIISIKQKWLPSPEGAEGYPYSIRLRRTKEENKEKFEHTVKHVLNSRAKLECTTDLTIEEFVTLWKKYNDGEVQRKERAYLWLSEVDNDKYIITADFIKGSEDKVVIEAEQKMNDNKPLRLPDYISEILKGESEK